MKEHVFALLAATALVLAVPAKAQVYKIVDENGNVTYTDQAPGPDAKPVDLPGLSIISPQQRPETPRSLARDVPKEANEVSNLGELRRSYNDFAIVAPKPDESLWGTGNAVQVAWDTRYRLQAGMSVVIYLDGEAQPPTTSPVITFEQLDRGSHTVSAELYDRRNRKIATAEPVSFYIRQGSRLFPTAQGQGG
ncbi:MAG: DUF4124 domain-containing protein [Xanthomonadales bacterium]|nr:DUF4124 domain-containing protein [Xanthomonadales bacterium]